MANGFEDSGLGRQAYVNARVLDASCGRDEVGGVLIEDGVIVASGKSVRRADMDSSVRLYDCGGLCLSAGFLDMRVQFGGDDLVDRNGGIWRAAASGGVTSFVGLPDGEPLLDNKRLIDLMTRYNRSDAVKLYCYGTLTRGGLGDDLSEIGLMQSAGAVAFSDGRRGVQRSHVMLRLMLYGKDFDALLVQHPEDLDLANGGVMNVGEVATRLGLAAIPRQAESVIVARDIELLRWVGGRYHVAHVSCADSLRLIRQAKQEGLDITCDTAPHYFALNETAVEDYRTFAKVSPPLRSEADRQAVCEALRDGTIDIIASDHIPQSEDLKRLPFASAAAGVVGLETLLSVSLQLVHNGYLDLLGLVACLSYNPAQRLRLAGGTLAKGACADIVLFDPDMAWRLQSEDLIGPHKNTAFDGHLLNGRVIRTVCGGRCVYDNARFSQFGDGVV